MARYSKIESSILNDGKFNRLSDDAQLVFFRLLVHPHLTSLGAMRATVAGLASEIRWPLERLREALGEVFREGMVELDEDAHFLWLPNFLKHNQPESPNVVRSWVKALDYLPECGLRTRMMQHAQAFVFKLSPTFQEALPEVFLKASESLPESLRESITITRTKAITRTRAITITGESNDTRRKEQEDKGGVLPHIVAPARPDEGLPFPIGEVFNFWKATLGHPQAVLDDKRKALIRRALKSGYTLEQLCQAITGCSLTPYNLGKNDRGQRYDGLHVILKDADQIDRFIRNAQSPPRERNAAEALIDSNLAVSQEWLQETLAQEEKPHAVN